MHNQMLTTYQDALDYLYSFIDYEKRPPATPQAARYNLDRTHALLAAVGNPQQSLQTIVVAGSKGKGSTSAMLENILRSAGYHVGLWTSPHLHSYRERIQVDRQLISQEALINGVQRLAPLIEAFDTQTYGQPTTFELGFVLALRFFAEQQAQLAVLEVGMGGRYDCANTVTPLVSLITSISYDHTRLLGNSLKKIAYEKAGILKPGVPAFAAPQSPEVLTTLQQVAEEVAAPLAIAGEHGIQPFPQGSQRVPYPVEPLTALRGAFQRENARLALSAAMALRQQGLTITDRAMAQGLNTVQWPGRMEIAAEAPMLILDGAHNGDSARKLMSSLYAEFRFRRLLLVLGMSQDKQVEAILAALVPHVSLLILTHSRHPRAETDLQKVATSAMSYLHGALLITNDVSEALEQARAMARPADLICVTGSLFVVGEARELLGLASECD